MRKIYVNAIIDTLRSLCTKYKGRDTKKWQHKGCIAHDDLAELIYQFKAMH